MRFKRIFLLVLDSLGVGEAIDAEEYHDKGCNTLGHIIDNTNLFILLQGHKIREKIVYQPIMK